MNREKMVEEVYQKTLDTIPSIDNLSAECTSMIAVDYMLEKFGPLVEAMNDFKGLGFLEHVLDESIDARDARVKAKKALKQLEE